MVRLHWSARLLVGDELEGLAAERIAMVAAEQLQRPLCLPRVIAMDEKTGARDLSQGGCGE